MAEKTKIEWCDSTANGEVGCDGCELWSRKAGGTCYAAAMVERYAGANPAFPARFDEPEIYPHRILEACAWKDLRGAKRPGKPWLDGQPRMIFLDDMGDTFTRKLDDPEHVARVLRDYEAPPRWGERVYNLAAEIVDAVRAGKHWLTPLVPAMAAAPHVWMVLTKRPSRMRRFADELAAWPANFWPMASVTSQASVSRLHHLKAIDSPIHCISFEPVLEAADLAPYLDERTFVIFGGESGPAARPTRLSHLRGILDACRAAGATAFCKQQGSVVVDEYGYTTRPPQKGGDWSTWPEWLKVREWPAGWADPPAVGQGELF